MKLFCFGLGYSARAVVERLRPRLDAVWGTTRDASGLPEMERLGVTPLLSMEAPGLLPPPRPSPAPGYAGAKHRLRRGERGEGSAVGDALASADHVLVSIPPGADGDPVLNHHRAALAAARPASIVYLSTVGVYGDHGGAWVDEASECRPVSQRSRLRLAAENAEWLALCRARAACRSAIIRLAGIYGPGRGPFEKIRRGTARRIVKPGQVFNRIHVDDIAAIVEAAFDKRADGVFNGVDDEPAPPEDVLACAAELFGVPPPPEVRFEDAEMTPMARSFYGENKRVRNDGIKRELGVELRLSELSRGAEGGA